MCEYFVKADPIQYEQRTRTVRIHGVLTSIRLENMVWDVLAEMAQEESVTTNQLIAAFHDEILAHLKGARCPIRLLPEGHLHAFLRRMLTAAERARHDEDGLEVVAPTLPLVAATGKSGNRPH